MTTTVDQLKQLLWEGSTLTRMIMYHSLYDYCKMIISQQSPPSNWIYAIPYKDWREECGVILNFLETEVIALTENEKLDLLQKLQAKIHNIEVNDGRNNS